MMYRVENVHGVDDTRDPTQDGQQDVDEEVRTAAALEEDTQRRQDEGKDDLADIAVSLVDDSTCVSISCWRG